MVCRLSPGGALSA